MISAGIPAGKYTIKLVDLTKWASALVILQSYRFISMLYHILHALILLCNTETSYLHLMITGFTAFGDVTDKHMTVLLRLLTFPFEKQLLANLPSHPIFF